MSELKTQGEIRRQKLMDNSAFLQFNWKANVVESWIGIHFEDLSLVQKDIVFFIQK